MSDIVPIPEIIILRSFLPECVAHTASLIATRSPLCCSVKPAPDVPDTTTLWKVR